MEDDGARARAINDEAAALFAAGRLAQAREAFERAIALVPGYAEAWQNLAVVRLRLGEPEGALDAMRRALEAAPRDATLWHELAQLLRRLGKPVHAAEALARAAAIAPGDPAIAEDRGRMALSLKRPAEARKHVDALGRRPGALSVRARAAAALGDREEALRSWHTLFDLSPCHTGAVGGLLATLLYEGGDPREVPRVAQAWARACGKPPPPAPQTARDPRRVLRVGYVSPDFRRHSVGWFALPAIAAHDRRAVEVFLYPTETWDDDMTAQFRAVAGPRWKSIAGLEADAAAATIRADAIDLLVDLAGHTEGGRLDVFMRKPAPLQLSWLGWPATTGVAAIDGRLTDAIADPPDADPASVEAPLRLADGFHVWRPPSEIADLPPAALPPGATVFGSFNDARKVGTASVALWARVLAAAPDAILWLRSEALAEPEFARRLEAAFAATGVPASRLRLEGARPRQRPHFAAYGAMHVALDPVPYNGATTTVEALWMGVPVIALGGGDRHAARVGASLLTHAGMPELIARDAEDYVGRAVALARDRERLGQLRAELRGRLLASPLMDEAGFARRLEAAYRELWQRHCAAR